MIHTRKRIPVYLSERSVICLRVTQRTQPKAKDNQNRRSVAESSEEMDIKLPMILSCLSSAVVPSKVQKDRELDPDRVIMPSIPMNSKCKSSKIRSRQLNNRWKGESRSLSRFKMHR